jgi:hypothetical protein
MSRSLAFVVAASLIVAACTDTNDPLVERHDLEVVSDTLDLAERRVLTVRDLLTGGTLRSSEVTVSALDTTIVGIVGADQAVEGRTPGTTTIEVRRVADTRDVARVSVTVRAPRVKFTTPAGPIEIGRTAVASAELTGKAPAVTWRTSDANVLAIDPIGPTSVNLIGRSIGTVTLTAIGVADTTRQKSVAVTVTPIGVATISVSPTPVVLRGRDMRASVFITLRDARNNVLNDRVPAVAPEVGGVAALDRVVADTSLAEIYTTELVIRPVGPGTVKFSVTIDGKRAEFPVMVKVGGPDSVYVNTGRLATLRPTLNDYPPLSVRITALVPPRNGTASIGSTTTIDYTSTAGFVGLDSLSYIAVDPSGQTDTVPVRLIVMPGTYTMTPIISMSAGITATDLNQSGVVTGTLSVFGSPTRAFRWSTSSYTLLPVASPTDASRSTAINDLGDVVGVAGGRPVLWRADAAAPLDLDPDRSKIRLSPLDINNRQEIAFSELQVWRNARIDTVTLAGYGCFSLRAINNRGDLLLEDCLGPLYTHWRVVLGAGGNYGGSCHPGRQSHSQALNELGWVLSHDEDQVQGGHRPALHSPTDPCVRLSSVYDRTLSAVTAFNNRGWILGVLQSAVGTTTPVLLVSGATIPLDKLASTFGWRIVSATRVNDAGQILVEALEFSTQQRAWFLLSPP